MIKRSYFENGNAKVTMGVVIRHSKRDKCKYEFLYNDNTYRGSQIYYDCRLGDSVKVMFSLLDPNYNKIIQEEK